jgi:hypothetical protein
MDHSVRLNPGEDPALDVGTLLQTTLLSEGLQNEFSEDDLFRALDALGVAKDDQGDWFESFASYL